ncbi:hypothetical protein E2C01_037166 [Portunus trituberculatus]|uniref:Uncharacterized protein n=1 Tax=Portunus trituberculatus TaxID=210409 RepID=A0A5B7FD86_PORTR|nr:hypothetical protein [Portunus trituberculatus]
MIKFLNCSTALWGCGIEEPSCVPHIQSSPIRGECNGFSICWASYSCLLLGKEILCQPRMQQSDASIPSVRNQPKEGGKGLVQKSEQEY